METDVNKIREEAKRRYKAKIFEQAVEEYVKKLEAKRWWHVLLPFRIVIIKREKV